MHSFSFSQELISKGLIAKPSKNEGHVPLCLQRFMCGHISERPLSVVSVVAAYEPSSILFLIAANWCDQFEIVAQSAWGNLLPSCDVDYY